MPQQPAPKQDRQLPTHSQLRRRKPYRLAVGIGVPVFVLAGAWLVYSIDPSANILPACTFYQLTGWDCIGCGTTRALHELLHGQVLSALSHNLVTPFLLLIPAYFLLAEWLQAVFGRPILKPIQDKKWLMIALLMISLVYFVLRNLPWAPFTWLAA